MVQVGGIRVGRVQDVTLEDSTVVVKFEVDHGVEFGKESEASIEVLNLLGEKYLELTPAGEGQLAEDTPIPLERTESAYDIVGVFGDLTTTTEEIDTRPAGRRRSTSCRRRWTRPRPRSRPASDGIARLSETVASRDAQIQALLASSKDVTQGAQRPQRGPRVADGERRPGLPGGHQAQGGGAPAAGQRPDPRPGAARGGRGQPGADRPGPARRSTSCSTCWSARRRSSRRRWTRSAPTSPSSATSSAPARGSTPTPSTWPRSRPASSCRDARADDDGQRRPPAPSSPVARCAASSRCCCSPGRSSSSSATAPRPRP